MYAKTEKLIDGAEMVLSLRPQADTEHAAHVWRDCGDPRLGDIIDPETGRVILARMRNGHAIPGGSPVLAGQARAAQRHILDEQNRVLCGRWPG